MSSYHDNMLTVNVFILTPQYKCINKTYIVLLHRNFIFGPISFNQNASIEAINIS